MRVFLSVLILIFNLQSWIKADDIRDFQIEGMSIGDSLLDYFSEKEIQLFINHKYAFFYKNKEFVAITTHHTSQEPYKKITGKFDFAGVTIEPYDKQYIIHSLMGTLRFPKNITACQKKKKEIDKTLSSIFSKAKITTSNRSHSYDKTGNSKVFSTFYNFNGGYAATQCTDWSNKLEKKWYDRLKVTINDNEFDNFLRNVQYK